MTGLGRSLTSVVAVSWLATLASAQQVNPSASVDLAALPSGEVRLAIEPVVLSRTVIGLSLGRWWGGNNVQFLTPATTLSIIQPGIEGLAHPAREYMVDLYTRVYPRAFSATGPLHLSGYLGGFLGFDERELDQTSYCPVGYACPLVSGNSNAAPGICACPLVASSSGSASVCPCPPGPTPQVTHDHVAGVEPGAEVGVRALPTDYLVLELGAWARMITFRDPTGRFEEGQIDPRLTLSVGIRW